MTGLLDYIPGDSPLHRLNPLTKLFLSFSLCAACFLTANHFFVLGIIAFNLVLAALGGILGRSLKTVSAVLKFSFLFFVLQLFFVPQGKALLKFPFHIVITDQGLLFSLLFVLRITAAAMPLTLMFSVTPVSDISNALTKYLGIPYKYTFALTTAIRFIPLFSEEMAGIMEAQIARGVEFDTGNFFKKIKLLLPLCVPLLVSSVRKIEGGAISAELRGFNLRKRTSAYKRYPFGPADLGIFALCALISAAAALV
jgi:energy-coupling factor transport system permease protein